MNSINFGRWLLVWDAYKCHASVKKILNKQGNTHASIIPGGLTPLNSAKLFKSCGISVNALRMEVEITKYSVLQMVKMLQQSEGI